MIKASLFRAITLFMAATLLAGTQAPATAGVIPDDLLFKILDETPKLERSPSDEPKTRSYKVIGTDVRGYINPDIDDYGFLKNGQDLLIVPFASGGSGGVFDALLFTGVKTDKPRFIGYVPSPNGHLEIGISEGRLIVSTPNYGPGDSSCCPSSRDIITYAIDGITMTKLSSRTAREPALGRGR